MKAVAQPKPELSRHIHGVEVVRELPVGGGKRRHLAQLIVSIPGKGYVRVTPSFHDWFRFLHAFLECERLKCVENGGADKDRSDMPRAFFNRCFDLIRNRRFPIAKDDYFDEEVWAQLCAEFPGVGGEKRYDPDAPWRGQ